jgi:hypothetical protein
MKEVKAFLSGMAFPATILPFLYSGIIGFICAKIQSFPMFIPIVFGLWNILRTKLPKKYQTNYWLVGGSLGLIASLFGVFVLDIPGVFFGLVSEWRYMPIILIPILYGAIFRYLVKWLDKILKV